MPSRDSVAGLFGTAAARERSEAGRYRLLAKEARGRGDRASARVAKALAVEALARSRAILAHGDDAGTGADGGPDPGQDAAERWEEFRTGAGPSPYRLLAHAVAGAAAAFAGYAYAASNAADDAVRAMAEQLAREELDRAARLRRARRHAFRRVRSARAAAGSWPDAGASLAGTAGLVGALATRCRELGDEASAALLASVLPRSPLGDATLPADAVPTPETALRRALASLQAQAETLESLAARAKDEAALADALRALELVVAAIGRVTARLDALRAASTLPAPPAAGPP